MGMVSEFQDFIKRGNVLDLAVGVIIGGAFGKIVSSATDDLIMPVISLATGKIDFTNLFVALDGNAYATLAEAKKAGVATVAYGNFITAVINFLIIALVIFMIVRQANKFNAPPPAPPPAPAGPTPTEALLGEIRDLLSKR
ncbi:MAG: large conductance mechanosensitive channel protein MscL [Acidobacteria bacterium]|nr:large conductance mechanosensitive channel protein MscL [Acidobacteriota bacterium]